MARRAAILKRVSLEGLAEGWDSECYAVIVPASRPEYLDFMNLKTEGMTNVEASGLQYKFVKSHVVRGKIMILDDESGEMTLDDLQKDDIDTSVDLCDKLFMEICGLKFDPKDLETALGLEKKPMSSENSTETT